MSLQFHRYGKVADCISQCVKEHEKKYCVTVQLIV
jgi:hypothetical protein